MTRSKTGRAVVFVGVLLMGFVGGVAGSRLLAPAPAVAQAVAEPEPQELTVRKLTVVDDRGRERFGIGMPPHAGYSMHFMDENGETIWSAPGQPMPEEPMQ